MESLPKIINGCPMIKVCSQEGNGSFEEKRNANCNICRNFKNIHDKVHRLSKNHQKKLTEKLRIIRSKMKMIRIDSISVHDEEWGKGDDVYCYFCDKPIKKHETHKGFAVEYLGFITHLADAHHMASVKKYLQYHGRNEKFALFCKTRTELENFLSKVPDAERKYLAKLNILNHKDVKEIKEIEILRSKLVNEVLQSSVTDSNAEESSHNFSQTDVVPWNHLNRQNSKLNEKQKIPPWQAPEKNSQLTSEKSVIGPNIDTFMKHVANEKKKGLPVKRLQLKFGQKPFSTKWFPAFAGVWNKGRRRQTKSSIRGKVYK